MKRAALDPFSLCWKSEIVYPKILQPFTLTAFLIYSDAGGSSGTSKDIISMITTEYTDCCSTESTLEIVFSVFSSVFLSNK